MRGQSRSWRAVSLCIMAINLRWTSHSGARWGACGGARPNASHTDGAVLAVARRDKERMYHELLVSERCRLVVVAMETGGRWSKEATDFISSLAEAKAREAAPILRGSAFFGWRKRWTRMLAVSCRSYSKLPAVWLKPKLGRLHQSCGVLRSSVGGNDGPGCWLFPAVATASSQAGPVDSG